MADGELKPATLSPAQLFTAMEEKRNNGKGSQDSSPLPSKEAPNVGDTIPSVEETITAKVRVVEPEVATEFQTIRKPRNPTVQKVIDGVKGAFKSDGKPIVNLKAKSPQEMDELRRKVASEDAIRMKSVRRYAKKAKKYLRDAVVFHMSQCGCPDLSDEKIDTLVSIVREDRVQAGYRVVKNDIIERELSVEQMLAYTLGHYKVALDIKAAEQWVKHPTLFDIATVIMGIGQLGYGIFGKGGAIDKKIRSVVDGTYKPPMKRTVIRKPKSDPRVTVVDSHNGEPI